MMPINYSDIKGGGGNEEYFPKIGASKVMTIKSSERIDAPDDPRNFKSQTENFGFHYKLELDSGKYALLNIFALFNAFQEAQVNDGDTIRIEHPGRGEYIVTKKPKEQAPLPDYLKEIEQRHSVTPQQAVDQIAEDW